MEYYDIIFSGIHVRKIGFFIREIFDIKQDNIISSHFWSEDSGDYEFSDTLDLEKYFSENNTADIFSEKVRLNRIYNNVVLVITSDVNDIEVECNISETDFDRSDISGLSVWLEWLYYENIITHAKICSDMENNPLAEI